jgi:decaprenylphospho-beta-D-ribofuranose 2-oxidase
MTNTKRQMLPGWGRTLSSACDVWRPEKRRDVQSALYGDGSVIARGLGRSYGDASMQPHGTISTVRLNQCISFDTRKGIITVQSGVTLAELIDIVTPMGWFPFTIPGTKHITIGGAFACNVHGKNQYKDGDFAEHVLSITLMLPSGESVECTPDHRGDVFWATAGGMGMTGIIEQVTLQLRPISSSSLTATTYRVDSLTDMVSAFEHYRDHADYMVGWIDHMATGNDIGRGVFEAAMHTPTEDGGALLNQTTAKKMTLNVPAFFPSILLNRYTMGLYNQWRFKKYSAWRQAEIIEFDTFFHPLDRIGHWNRLYGKRGFFQYQCLFLETPDTIRNIHTFLTALQRKKVFSFLAVIKYHREGKGLLTFSKSGYSIALDFANTARVRSVLPQLDRWVAENGGRVYLAKDAMLESQLFLDMYGQQGKTWLDFIRSIDPTHKLHSLMSERLKWK